MSAVVVGLGSPYRRDDAVGPLVARLVSERSAALDVGSVEDPLDLLGLWDDADLCVVVDAVRSGREPGDVWAIELEPASDVEGVAPSSSHGVGLVGALRIARAIGRAPRRVVVVCVEAESFAMGEGLSAPVAAAVEDAVAAATRALGASPCA